MTGGGFPSTKDLVVIFHDKRGLVVDACTPRRECMVEHGIWVGVDQGEVFSVTSGQEYLPESSERE